jgi:hypothetical protein
MALIVEDGSIVDGAESYVTVSEADTYLAARGVAAWAALSPEQKEINLRLATDYLQANYAQRWKGYLVDDLQPLDWPRQMVEVANAGVVVPIYYGLDEIPEDLKRAQILLGSYAMVGDLLTPTLTRAVVSETVGDLSVTYDNATPQVKRYPMVAALLGKFLRGSSNMVRIER